MHALGRALSLEDGLPLRPVLHLSASGLWPPGARLEAEALGLALLEDDVDPVGEHDPDDGHGSQRQHEGKYAHVNLKITF